MINSTTLSGYTVKYESDDDKVSYGVDYLYKLNSAEGQTLISAAKSTGEASFNNGDGYHFGLVPQDSGFMLISKN